jgi:hypothetical protein
MAGFDRALDTATSRRSDLPLLLWRRGQEFGHSGSGNPKGLPDGSRRSPRVFGGGDLRATAQEGFCTPAGCQTRCCRGCSRLALPRIFELAPFGHGFHSSHCITTQLLAVRSAGRATLRAGPSNRRLVGSGTPVRGAGPTDALFRWSFPLCPERPPATLCQPSGLAYATEFR